jgi:hypothetical protein
MEYETFILKTTTTKKKKKTELEKFFDKSNPGTNCLNCNFFSNFKFQNWLKFSIFGHNSRVPVCQTCFLTTLDVQLTLKWPELVK